MEVLTCERCGRLLNRATGRCVCEEIGDVAPVAHTAAGQPTAPTTQPPAETPRATPAPIARPAVPKAAEPRPRAEPRPAARAQATRDRVRPEATAEVAISSRVPAGVIPRVHLPRTPGTYDVVVYEDSLVLTRQGGRGAKRAERLANLSPGQAAALHDKGRVIPASAIAFIDVAEQWSGGEARVVLNDGSRVLFSWIDPLRRRDVAGLLTSGMPSKVDLAEVTVANNVRQLAVLVGAGVLAVVALVVVVGFLLRSDPPPPPPAAPPTTLSPQQVAVRDALAPACGPWQALRPELETSLRPDPNRLRPVVDAMVPGFDAAAAADASLGAARAELGFLSELARRPVGEVANESGARISYAVRQVNAACARVT